MARQSAAALEAEKSRQAKAAHDAQVQAKARELLRYLERYGAADAVVVTTKDRVTVGRVFKKTVVQDVRRAAWIIHERPYIEYSDYDQDRRKYDLSLILSDGRFASCNSYLNPPLGAPLVHALPTTSDEHVLERLDRLIAKYKRRGTL